MNRFSGADARPWMERVALAFVVLSLAVLVAMPLVIQHRASVVREKVDQVSDPARTLVTRLQFSLSREMSSLRGFLITGDEQFLATYAQSLAVGTRILTELEPLSVQLGPEVLERFVEMRTLVQQWHARADDDAIVRRRRASPRFLAEIPVEQELFEQVLRSATALDSTIARAAQRSRAEIREVERFGSAFTGVLGFLAFCSAFAVGWFDRRVRRWAAEAEMRRGQAELALAETARATEARARLLRGVTHDVKNPLGAANGYADLLEMGVKGPLTPEQVPLVQGIRRSVDGALAIIADLLDMARADHSGLSIERVRVDMHRVVAEAAEDHRAAAEAAGHIVEWESEREPLEISTDPLRVKQVLGNLLSNAIKYMGTPGRITVRVVLIRGDRAAPGPGSWVAVRVRDSGPGIPPDQRQAIFDEFTRLQDRTPVAGHGLGLSISRRIARLLGGEITVDGAPGEGATFVLWLPCRDDAVTGSPTTTDANPAVRVGVPSGTWPDSGGLSP